MERQLHDPRIARMLILDELFDLSLYKALRELTGGESRKVLDELIEVETEHLSFWQRFFNLPLNTLDFPRRLKLGVMIFTCRIFGVSAIHLFLEAIEVHGVRKYLSLWEIYKDGPLGDAVKGILVDEFKHEDMVVTRLTERQINPEKIRNIFLGLNDGLVEILGAVSGFFGAFGDAVTVLVAAVTTAVAGALSMAAGAYVALSSEREVEQVDIAKRRFLGDTTTVIGMEERPLTSAIVVGGAYIMGALVPVLPVLFGAKDAFFSLLTAGSMIIVVSMLLAFLSGMEIKRRIMTNLIIIAAAVAVSYAIGTIARTLWGVSV